MRVAIIRLSALGDVIISSSVLPFLRKYASSIEWFVDERFCKVLEDSPFIDRLHSLPFKKLLKSPFGIYKIYRYCKNLGFYDYVIDMQGLLKSAIVGKCLNTKHFIGYSSRGARESLASLFYTHKVDIAYDENILVRNYALFDDVFEGFSLNLDLSHVARKSENLDSEILDSINSRNLENSSYCEKNSLHCKPKTKILDSSPSLANDENARHVEQSETSTCNLDSSYSFRMTGNLDSSPKAKNDTWNLDSTNFRHSETKVKNLESKPSLTAYNDTFPSSHCESLPNNITSYPCGNIPTTIAPSHSEGLHSKTPTSHSSPCGRGIGGGVSDIDSQNNAELLESKKNENLESESTVMLGESETSLKQNLESSRNFRADSTKTSSLGFNASLIPDSLKELFSDNINILFILEASIPQKMYGIENFCKLASLIHNERTRFYVIWNEHEDLANSLIAMLESRNLACQKLPKMDFNEVKFCISNMHCVIGGDTGITHLAWAMNIFCITLYGNQSGITKSKNMRDTRLERVLLGNAYLASAEGKFEIDSIAPEDIAEVFLREFYKGKY